MSVEPLSKVSILILLDPATHVYGSSSEFTGVYSQLRPKHEAVG